jgi:hypothetical protein
MKTTTLLRKYFRKKRYFYNDKKLKNLIEYTAIKFVPWESDDESVFIALDLFSRE